MRVGDRGGAAGRLAAGPRRGGRPRNDVRRDVALEHLVHRAPAPGAVDLVEQVRQPVPPAEDAARHDRGGHAPPPRTGRGCERDGSWSGAAAFSVAGRDAAPVAWLQPPARAGPRTRSSTSVTSPIRSSRASTTNATRSTRPARQRAPGRPAPCRCRRSTRCTPARAAQASPAATTRGERPAGPGTAPAGPPRARRRSGPAARRTRPRPRRTPRRRRAPAAARSAPASMPRVSATASDDVDRRDDALHVEDQPGLLEGVEAAQHQVVAGEEEQPDREQRQRGREER